MLCVNSRLLAIRIESVADAVLDAADGILGAAFGLIHLAFGFGLAVAGQLAETFLDLAADILGRTFDAILINHFDPSHQSGEQRPGSRQRSAAAIMPQGQIVTKARPLGSG